MAKTDQTWTQTDPPAPEPRIWNTASVSATEAFDYYREGICAAFMPLRPELARDRRHGFSAEIASYPVDGSVLNLVSARTHTVLRRRGEIAASPQDCYYLNYQLGGECRISQHGRRIALRTGEVGIFDSASAFDLEHDRHPALRVASLMVPKEVLQARAEADLPQAPLLLSHHPVLGPLVTEAARSLAEAVAWAPEAELARLHGILLSLTLLAALPAGTEAGASNTADSRAAAQLARIKRIIRHRCATPGYSVAACAAEAGMTPRSVHRLFAREAESFGAFLLRERLQRAARLLRAPGHAHVPVSAIGYEAGFRDPSHFARAFRGHYGQSPGAWRRQRAD